MILYKLSKNNNKQFGKAYGKVYAHPVITETISIPELAEHLAEHNTGFSPGAVQGLLTDMVRCVKELVLKGIAVKIDNLAIFSMGIRTKKGAESVDDFSVAKNIEGVRLRARATGALCNSKLDLSATLKNAATLIETSVGGTPVSPSSPTKPSGSDPDKGGDNGKGDSSADSGDSAGGSKTDDSGTSLD